MSRRISARVGIRELADELQLSVATVSRALNDRPDVNPETRARVKARALQWGYAPNLSGRSLRRGRTGMVATLVPSFGAGIGPTFLAVLEGARRVLSAAGFDLVVMFRGPEEDRVEAMRRMLDRWVADAVVITETLTADARVSLLRERGVEFVCFGRTGRAEDEPVCVDFDFVGAVHDAVGRFVASGHRRFALVTEGTRHHYEAIMGEAFHAAIAGAGPALDARNFVAPVTEPHALAHAAGAGATAIIVANGRLGARLHAALAEAGRLPGRDVSLVSVLPIHAVENHGLAMASYAFDLDAVGVELARRLLAHRTPGGGESRPVSAHLASARLVAASDRADWLVLSGGAPSDRRT